MSELKLLRRPLSPKMKMEHLIPSRKRLKGICEEDTTSKEIHAADVEKFLPSAKSQPIYLCFPEYESEIHVPSNIKRNFVIPVQSSGPPSFPLQKRRVPFRLQIPTLPGYHLSLPSDFILRGLAAEVDSLQIMSSRRERTRPIISRLNYEVLTSQLIAEQMRGPQEVNTILLSTSEDFPDIIPRKPWRQMLIEKILEEHLTLSSEEKLMVLEEGFQQKKKKRVTNAELGSMDFGDSYVSGAGVKPQLILEDEESEMMTKAELAVLYCQLHRRTGLSLKAYFISQLPDLSSLADFLLYLNLSFNYLYFFPAEVYKLKYLEVLKLRNNPIKYIPEDINQMKHLKVLIISFNLLTSLPSGLFSLPNLQALDVSYNEIEFISSEIGKLRSLVYLNLEGNLLHVLPCGLLKLSLNRLKVENNFLHAYFWSEFCQMEPSRLFDMAALCFTKHKLWDIYREIPIDIVEKLHNFTACDCCTGPLYGKGICFIRIYRNLYGLRLPYLFCACSPTCYMRYITSV